MIHLDTSFLVDLGRELKRDEPGPATQLLLSLGDGVDVGVSVHAICELLAGAQRARRPTHERRQVETMLQHLAVVYPGPGYADVYARLYAHLEARGERIGTMDLLIATAAVSEDAALVSRDRRHFARVPDLELIGY